MNKQNYDDIDMNSDGYASDNQDYDGEEITSSSSSAYIRPPAPGDTLTITLGPKGFRKMPQRIIKGKNGEADIILSPKNKKNEIDPNSWVLFANDGKECTLTSWSPIIMIRDIITQLGVEANAQVTAAGQTFRIEHLADGMDKEVRKNKLPLWRVSIKKADDKFYSFDKDTKKWTEVTA